MPDEPREEQSPGLGEQARALREDLSPERLNKRLEEVIEERPKTRYVLDYGIFGKALLAAVVVALVLWLVVGAAAAAIGLVVVFFGGWLLGAQVSYDRRRGTRDVRESDDDGESEEDTAPARQAEARAPDADSGDDGPSYQGNRGEVEAEQEQDDEHRPGRNGTDPRHQHADR
jgi:hypothetical protein